MSNEASGPTHVKIGPDWESAQESPPNVRLRPRRQDQLPNANPREKKAECPFFRSSVTEVLGNSRREDVVNYIVNYIMLTTINQYVSSNYKIYGEAYRILSNVPNVRGNFETSTVKN